MTQSRGTPDGYHTITAHLVIRGVAAAIDFYKRALGAQEIKRFLMPGTEKIIHAEMKLGDSRICLSDEFPEWGAQSQSPSTLKGTAVSIAVYVEDVDKVFQQAVAAGGQPTLQPTDMLWGDRLGKFTDPFGHQWQVASNFETVPMEEIERRTNAFFAGMAGTHKS